jgi:hypothetical protein
MTRWLALGLLLSASACGGDAASPASPTPVPTTASVSRLEIVGPFVVPAGSNVTYSATATMSNGSVLTRVRPVVWTSDNVDVAAINSAGDGIGELTGRREGMVTITATHEGKSSTLSIDVRDPRTTKAGANLVIDFTPDPVPGSQTQCQSGAPGGPSWTFTERVTETLGVGFTQENLSFTLYDNDGIVIYTDTFAEKYYFPPSSSFSEEFCTPLFRTMSGFYADVYEGVDDFGNRRAFASGRLRLLSVDGAPSLSTLLVSPSSRPLARGGRRRIR